MISNVVKNSWNWNFADFRDLVLILPELVIQRYSVKKVFLKILQDSQESEIFCEYCEIFKNTFFYRTLPMAAYFATVAGFILSNHISWHLSSSEKSLVGKKWSIYFKDFTYLDLFYTDIFFSFSLTNACLPCQLRKAYGVVWAANGFVASGTPKQNAFD